MKSVYYNKGQKIAYIDICGTVFYSNTTFDFLNYYLKGTTWKMYSFIYKTYIWKVFNKFVLKFFNVDITRKIAISFLKNKKIDHLREAAQNFYDTFLQKRCNKKAFEIITQLKSEGYVLYYISATLDLIAENISKNTGIPVLLSTELQYSENFCKGKYKKEVLNNKLDILEQNNNLADSFVILTDNLSDLPLVVKSQYAFLFMNKKTKTRWEKLFINKDLDVKKIKFYEY